jgi:hypothetical protein
MGLYRERWLAKQLRATEFKVGNEQQERDEKN